MFKPDNPDRLPHRPVADHLSELDGRITAVEALVADHVSKMREVSDKLRAMSQRMTAVANAIRTEAK